MTTTPGFVNRVVKNCLRIGKSDRVAIHTWKHTIPLAEAFAIECREAGAKTIIELITDELYYKTILGLPIEYLKQPDPYSLAMLDVNTAAIFISGPEDPERLKQIEPERMGAMVEADKPYLDRFLEKKIRAAEMTIGHVTRHRAKTYGFNYDDWNENMHAALDVEYEYMRNLGRKIGNMLELANDVHITTQQGTDFRLELVHQTAHISDGVVDDEDIQKGDVFTSLPAGNVAVVPKERSAKGIFISDAPEADSGLLLRGITWKFEDGRLVSFKGEKNVEATLTRWECAEGDKDQLGVLMLGLNPKAKTGFLYNPIVLGTLTLSIGDNREFGGKMESNFGFHCSVSKPTLELDGKIVIKDGKLEL